MNNYNFQIIPPHSGKVRQIRIEGSKLKRLLIWLSIIVVLNLLVFGINIYFVLNTTSQTKLATINKELLNKLEQTSRRSDSLGLALSDIAKFTEQVRSLADLPPTDPGMFSYGIGGPELGYHDPNRPFVLAKAREVDRKLDSLIIAARLENEALTEAKTVFEKKQKVFAHTPSIWPMRGFVSSGFGKRLDPFTGIWKMHEGIDICARKGTPVRATSDGRVRFTGWYHGYGKTIRIDHIYYETRYAHLDEIKVQPGQRVKRGDIIGTCGNSGYATGVHLHYEVRISGNAVDPKQYLYPDVVVD